MILKTINQGANWERLSGYYFQTLIHDIHFPSVRTGYLLSGGYLDESPDYIYLSKTTNGGTTWISNNFGTPAQGVLKTIFFTDSLTGYVGGQKGQILKTNNGGNSWQAQNSSAPNDTIERIHFVSASTGFAIGGRQNRTLLLRTTNAGTSWLPTILPVSNGYLNAIWFVSPTTGYVAGENNLLLKTTNGGQSWSVLLINGGANLKSVWFKDMNTGFITEGSGTVWKTNNAGQSWESRQLYSYSPARISDLKCIDNTCFAVGYESIAGFSSATPVNLISLNMGESWAALFYQSSIYSSFSTYTKLYFAPSGRKYLLGDFAFFFEYNNGVGTSVFKPKPTKAGFAFELYPNPSMSGKFTIRHTYLSKKSLIIRDARGQIIKQSYLDNSEFTMKLPAGLYFVKLENANGSSVQKLILH